MINTRTGDGESENTRSPFIIRVRNWFSRRQDWLLILDGINFTDSMTKFMPDNSNTSIIFTSTENSTGADHHFLNPQLMKLPNLSAREAQMLMLLELDKVEPISNDDLRYSMALVHAMGFLPLVIHSTALRLKATDEPLSRFAKKYSADPKLSGLGTYREIVKSLKQLDAFEPLILIYLLCFFGQQIPVEMISLGMHGVDVDIKTADAVIGKSLNNSFKILSSFALIDRIEYDQNVVGAGYNYEDDVCQFLS